MEELSPVCAVFVEFAIRVVAVVHVVVVAVVNVEGGEGLAAFPAGREEETLGFRMFVFTVIANGGETRRDPRLDSSLDEPGETALVRIEVFFRNWRSARGASPETGLLRRPEKFGIPELLCKHIPDVSVEVTSLVKEVT